MPIRPIYNKAKNTNAKYKGVYELVNTKNKVTGYYVNYADENGKTIKTRAVDANNRDEALLYLNQLKHDVKRAKASTADYVSDKRLKRIKLNDLATEYFDATPTLDNRVSARYDNHIREHSIGTLIVDRITIDDVNDLKYGLQNKKFERHGEKHIGLAEGTINHILAMVKTIIKYGIQKRYCSYNIFNEIDVNRKSRERMRILTPTEVYELIENAGKINIRLQMFVRMLYFTAQRPKTVLEMQRKHIDLKKGTIYIPKIKNQRETLLPISDKLRPHLEKWIKDLKVDHFLFHRMKHPQGTGFEDPTSQVSSTQMRKASKKLFEPYNEGLTSRDDSLMKVSFYTLRHSSATHILEATNNIYLVKKILNHSDIKMTERYAKMTDSAKKDGLDAL